MKIIKELQEEISTLTAQMAADKEENIKAIAALQEGFDTTIEAERKKTFEMTGPVAISEKETASMKQLASHLYTKSVLLKRDPASFAEEFKTLQAFHEKAIIPSDLSNWLAEEFSNQALEELELELRVESLFPRIAFPDNRDSLSIPARDGNAKAYLIAPAVDAIASAFNTAKITFQTQRIKTLIEVADQSDDQAVVAVVDLVRKEVVRSIARAGEDAIINGDTAFADPNDVKAAFDGLMKLGLTQGVDAAGPFAVEQITALRKNMGVYGMSLNDLAIIAPIDIAYDMLDLPQVQTVDKYGPMATIHTGEIGKLYGIPIIVSEYISDDLGIDGTPTTPAGKTAVILVNKAYFAMATRGSVTLEEDRNISSSVNSYVGWRDIDFKQLLTAATPVAVLYNLG